MHRVNKYWQDHAQLHDDNLERMDRCHRPRGGLEIPMMDVVEVFEQKFRVKRPMNPISRVILYRNDILLLCIAILRRPRLRV